MNFSNSSYKALPVSFLPSLFCQFTTTGILIGLPPSSRSYLKSCKTSFVVFPVILPKVSNSCYVNEVASPAESAKAFNLVS